MALSSDLISQFVKITNDKKQTKKETTTYGTTVEYNGAIYVQLDGSELLTPISTTADTKPGERVSVMIKNHTATVTGNLSSPAARTEDVQENTNSISDASNKISGFEVVIADKVDTVVLNTEKARIDDLSVNYISIQSRLHAAEGDISDLEADTVTIKEDLRANDIITNNLQTSKLDVTVADATYATISELDATKADIHNLEANYGDFVTITSANLTSVNATIDSLSTTYANIDFSNIGSAAMEYLYSYSGLIENVVIGDGTITGTIVGVTIKGDSIEANSIVADKIVIQGEDGLYYKLNTDGATTGVEQTDYNSLNGQIIAAKTITATQVSVSDLVAFDATIGGFNITANSIYSDVKDSEGNTTRGIYMDTDGQINFGDASNFIKYYKDDDGTYKLSISAASILYALNGKQYSIADIGKIGDYVHIGTYEDEPCIELGESDSDFRLIITNTRIMFMEESDVPAYINNQSLNIKKAVIEEELQQGNFVWKIRSNGNMGLVWKG